MNRFSLITGATLLVAGFGMTGTAEAATATRLHFENATGFCQSALPIFDGNVRKRPTAVANEGTSNAFISCSMAASANGSTGIEVISLFIYNKTAVAVNVTCSLVNHYQAGGTVVPKTQSVRAIGIAEFVWTRGDVGNPASMKYANFSCNLPPGTEVGYGYYRYSYEIGS